MTGLEVGTVVAIAGVAASAAGTAVAVMGQMQAADAASRAAAYNASVARANAVAAQQQAQQNSIIQGQQARQKMGGITAAYGASGVDSGSGSALDVLGNSAANAELDRQTLIYHGALASSGYQDEAALDAARIGSAQSSAMSGAAGLLLSGGAKAFNQARPLLTPANSNNTISEMAGNPLLSAAGT